MLSSKETTVPAVCRGSPEAPLEKRPGVVWEPGKVLGPSGSDPLGHHWLGSPEAPLGLGNALLQGPQKPSRTLRASHVSHLSFVGNRLISDLP